MKNKYLLFLFLFIFLIINASAINIVNSVSTASDNITILDNGNGRIINSHISADGLNAILFFDNDTSDYLFHYNLSRPFELSTAIFKEKLDLGNIFNITSDMHISYDGQIIILGGRSNANLVNYVLRRYNLASAYNVSTASFQYGRSSLFNSDGIGSFSFISNGLNMFSIGQTDETFKKYSMSTPFDIRTLNNVQNVTKESLTGAGAHGLSMSADGRKFYAIANTINLMEYSMSTPFDLSTMQNNSINQTLSRQSYRLFMANNTFIYSGDTTNTTYQYNTLPTYHLGTSGSITFNFNEYKLISNGKDIFNNYNNISLFIDNALIPIYPSQNYSGFSGSIKVFDINFTTSQDINMRSFNTTYNFNIIVLACNNYISGALCNAFPIAVEIKEGAVISPTPQGSVGNSATNYLNSFFPDYTTLSFKQKMAYVILTMLLISVFIIVLVSALSGTFYKEVLYLVGIIDLLFFFYFIGIHYISIAVLIILVLIALPVSYFILRGNKV